jgi:tetratricopeptide (TPR) repeat protein
MRSSSRNSRESFRVLGLAAAVSLLLGSAAQSAEQHNFVLTAYTNGRGGQELVTGKFDEAGKALHQRHALTSFDASTTSNNRCVALAVTKQWDAAKSACDEAVRDAEAEQATLPSYQYWARDLEKDYVAVALSNRAVLHWMSSEHDAAAADLKKAAELAPKAGYVLRNESALEYSRTSVAQVGVTASSH